MNKFLIKHKNVCSFIFTFIILEWFLLGNVTAVIISKWNFYLDTETAMIYLIVLSVLSSLLLNGCIPNKRLNLYELFINASLPVMLYYTLKTIDYSIIPLSIFLIVSTLLSIAIIYLQKLAKVRKIRVVYYLRHIIALCTIVIIIPSFLCFQFDDKAIYEYFEQTNIDSMSTQDSNADEEKTMELLANCNWDKLNSEERSDILYEVVKYEASVLGIPAPKLQVVNTQRKLTLGSYDNLSKTISLNNFHLGQNSLEECLHTSMHELYHDYQDSVIDILNDLPVSVAHEISHHLLGHTSDGAKQHQEAQLMACIIVAPIKLIHKFKIKSPSQLSEICKIPIDAAEDYWNEITKNEGRFYSLNKSNAIKIIVIILSLAMITLPIYFNYAKRIDYTGYERNFEGTTYLTPSTNPTDSPPHQSTSQTVYVTKTGKKYHLADCRHIKNVEYIIEFSSAEKAENAGYLPCKDCIK